MSDDNLHYVAAVEDLEDGDRILADVEGQEIAVFNVGGEYHALVNFCVHQGGPVCEGVVTGTLSANEDDDWALEYDKRNEVLSCPWHGWEFDVTSGEHLARRQYRLPKFDVEVKDGEIYVEL